MRSPLALMLPLMRHWSGALSLAAILFKSQWRARGLDNAIASVDPDALCAEYSTLRQAAPRRSLVDKVYFVGHTGVASAAGGSNRLEEHSAIALTNLGRRWPRPEGDWFRTRLGPARSRPSAMRCHRLP